MSDHENTPNEELCDSACLDLLNSERRRTVLEQLVGDDRTHSLDSLVTAIAQTDRAITSEQARISLHHAHLPKLESAGVVDYDSQEQTVEYLGSPSIERWLDRIDE